MMCMEILAFDRAPRALIMGGRTPARPAPAAIMRALCPGCLGPRRGAGRAGMIDAVA
jgi:hypothetical protein